MARKYEFVEDDPFGLTIQSATWVESHDLSIKNFR
jgi:hypothetical protein